MSLQPLFIAGCDRSGTTMLGDILGASPKTFSAPESQWIHQLARMLHVGAFADAQEAAVWLQAQFRFAAWGMAQDTAALAELIRLEDPGRTVEMLIRSYVEQKLPAKARLDHWVDHTPDNFKHYPVLKALFPQALYVHIVRDGRAVFQSIKTLDWGPNNAYVATRYWCSRLEQATGVELAEGDRCLRVRYEDILRDPALEVSRICEFAGIPFAEAMLNGGGVILPEFTESQHKLVGRRPDPSRLEAWREELSRHEIEDFEAYPLSRTYMQAMGYKLTTMRPVVQTKLRILWSYLHDFSMYLLHRLRHLRLEKTTLNQQRRS